MRARVVFAAVAAAPVAIVAFVGWQYHAVTHPVSAPKPLPDGLIGLDTPEGRRLLDAADHRADADALIAAFQPQQEQHWAGVAAVAATLTALGRPTTQGAFFTPATEAVRPWWRIAFTGMTLDDLGGMFVAHGAKAAVHHADEGEAAFRAELARNLSTPGDVLVVNYARATLEQGQSGNLAPVAAWDEASDRVLVLDQAAFSWAPAWVPADALFDAMDTVDGEVGRKRGWVTVSAR